MSSPNHTYRKISIKINVCFEQLEEAECRTAVTALRAAIDTGAAASAQDVPNMMCQILQELVQDHNTVRLIRYKKSHCAMRNRQNTSVNLLQWLNTCSTNQYRL